MSIERYSVKNKPRYRVRFRRDDNSVGSKTFDTKQDAQNFESEVRRLRQTGELLSLDRGYQTLSQYLEVWYRGHGKSLAKNTLASYTVCWEAHIEKKLGRMAIRRITPSVIAEFRDEMDEDGKGVQTQLKVLSFLSGILGLAAEREEIPGNPVKAIRKPRLKNKPEVRVLPPSTVEALRDQLHFVKSKTGEWVKNRNAHRDRTLVSILAYSGIRPGEAMFLKWNHINNTILVEGSLFEDETKTHKNRNVRLLPPLSQDLNEWYMAQGRPHQDTYVIPRGGGGYHFYKNWRKRNYQPAAALVDAPSGPYSLRHSFASLLLWAGINPVEVAAEMGHSLSMLSDTYAHVIEELKSQPRVAAGELIRQARMGESVKESQVGAGSPFNSPITNP